MLRNLHKLVKLFGFILLFFTCYHPNTITHAKLGNLERFQEQFQHLLQQYWHPAVNIHGIQTSVFDYAKMTKDFKPKDSRFKQTLETLKKINPDELFGDNHEKAFWLNVYNFAAMKLIVDHYPVDSIRSFKISLIKYPWAVKTIKIGNSFYSLKQIEKEILLKKFSDPRIVFAVNCAAVSCPDRLGVAFTVDKIDAQLDAIIQNFLKNPGKGLLLDSNSKILKISWIFKKDAHLFTGHKDGVLGFLKDFVGPGIGQWISKNKNTLTLEYLDHDWTLNDLAQANKK